MKITNEQASYLLSLPKKIFKGDELLSKITINQKFPFIERFELLSEENNEFSFLWEIKQSAKNTLKISLHVQENDSKIGLMRIDYNGAHTNPEIINDFVPEKFHQYAGKEFTNSEHHVHYHVQGYKTLAWAIPLIDDDFEIKTIENEDFNNSLANIVVLFAKTINIETVITINTLLL
jgi:hypothetical protein